MTPAAGCRELRSPLGIEIFRVHYSADPDKDATWAAKARAAYPSEALWRQEQEIDFGAFLGTRLFPEFQPQLTVIKPYRLDPAEHTFYMAIDPHPRVPHAFLWLAVSRGGDHIYCGEYWPSKVYGRSGDVPEDDELYHIDDYVETVKFLESEKPDLFAPNGFMDNGGRALHVYRRIMDPYGKAVAAQREHGKEGTETFWDRYQELGIYCEAAKKDFQAGRDRVGKRLRSRTVIDEQGERKQSQILIFSTCIELIWELENNRYPVLTPEQAARRDPSDLPLPKRKHVTDLLRYLEITDPAFVAKRDRLSLPPVYSGVAY